MPENASWRLSAIARAFVALAVGAPVLWARDAVALGVLLVVAMSWLLVALIELLWRWPSSLLLMEAAALGAALGSIPNAAALFGLMVVPVFAMGLRRGTLGVLLALASEFSVTVLSALLKSQQMVSEVGVALLTWGSLGFGLGLVAAFVRDALDDEDTLSPYRHASDLLRQLNDLSVGLSAGLDPRSLGGLVLDTVLDQIPASAVSISVPLDDHLAALAVKTFPGGDVDRCAGLAERSWVRGQVVIDEGCFAFPLEGHRSLVAVVAGTLPSESLVDQEQLRRRVRHLQEVLVERSVPLQTGLLFEGFRDTATADERQRLSREMHDGVAQDIASLGYVVDALAAAAPTPAMEAQLAMLRERITNIVAEVRRSVTTLRTTVGTSESLGTAIIGVTRNLSQTSGVPIEVTLDEQPQRLRPEVEAELFRIAQEALNNAVKHAQASIIRVHCHVAAPYATISVRDDGRGLGAARTDSYGMGIMRERAHLIDAELSITEPPDGGLDVTVRLSPEPTTPAPPVPRAKQVTSPR